MKKLIASNLSDEADDDWLQDENLGLTLNRATLSTLRGRFRLGWVMSVQITAGCNWRYSERR